MRIEIALKKTNRHYVLMQTIRTDFASKVGTIFEIYNMFHNTKREKQPYNRLVFSAFYFEPRVGLEPTTFSLRMKCSTN